MTLITLPCTMLELETALHGYGDHHGFDKKVKAHVKEDGSTELQLELEGDQA